MNFLHSEVTLDGPNDAIIIELKGTEANVLVLDCHHRCRRDPESPVSPGTTEPPGDFVAVLRLDRQMQAPHRVDSLVFDGVFGVYDASPMRAGGSYVVIVRSTLQPTAVPRRPGFRSFAGFQRRLLKKRWSPGPR